MSTSSVRIKQESISHIANPDPKYRELVQSFLSGRKEQTIKAYSQDLADFTEFLNQPSIAATAQQLLSHGAGEANHSVLKYRIHLIERELSPATINRRLAAIRSLVRLANMLGIVTWEIKITGVKVQPYRDTRGPGKQGFVALLTQVRRKRTPKASRDYLALRLLYDLALRASEVVSLDMDDVDLTVGTVAVQGKGRSEKQVLTMPEPTKQAFHDWITKRGSEAGPVFLNFDRARKGQRLTSVSLYRIVRKIGESVGIKTRPHGLRHTAITEACKAAQEHGFGLEEVLDFSRHSRNSISVLLLYRDRERNAQGQIASLVAVS